jgi:hypothetical protein
MWCCKPAKAMKINRQKGKLMEEPVEMTRKFKAAASRGEQLGLADETLKRIAHELVPINPEGLT